MARRHNGQTRPDLEALWHPTQNTLDSSWPQGPRFRDFNTRSCGQIYPVQEGCLPWQQRHVLLGRYSTCASDLALAPKH